MRIHLLGVRGSTPAPGADFVRYGGHTSCIAVTPAGRRLPTLLLDAGTGIRSATNLVAPNAFRGSILLSHLHWDHVQGLPFCAAADHADADVDVFLPAQQGMTGRDLLARTMSPPDFPIEPEGLHGQWRFHAINPGTLETAGLEVRSVELTHKGGRTFGYRVSDGRDSIAYLPDHSPARGCSAAVRELISGVDLLVHDAQFVSSEREIADAYGHATVDDTIDLAVRTRPGALMLFHHSPTRTDACLDALARSITAPMPVLVAREGMVLEVSEARLPTTGDPAQR